MSLQTDLQQAVAQVTADSALLHSVVHGTDQQSITTEGGPVSSVAKLLAEADARINVDAEGVLAQTREVADVIAGYTGQAAESLQGAEAARQQAEAVLIEVSNRIAEANQAAGAAQAAALDAADRRDETTVLRDSASLAATDAAQALAEVPNAVRQTVDVAIAALPARMDPRRQLFLMKLIGLI